MRKINESMYIYSQDELGQLPNLSLKKNIQDFSLSDLTRALGPASWEYDPASGVSELQDYIWVGNLDGEDFIIANHGTGPAYKASDEELDPEFEDWWFGGKADPEKVKEYIQLELSYKEMFGEYQ